MQETAGAVLTSFVGYLSGLPNSNVIHCDTPAGKVASAVTKPSASAATRPNLEAKKAVSEVVGMVNWWFTWNSATQGIKFLKK